MPDDVAGLDDSPTPITEVERLLAVASHLAETAPQHPRSAYLVQAQGAIAERLGFDRMALDHYRQAIALAPDEFGPLYRRAIVQTRLGMVEDARSEFKDLERRVRASLGFGGWLYRLITGVSPLKMPASYRRYNLRAVIDQRKVEAETGPETATVRKVGSLKRRLARSNRLSEIPLLGQRVASSAEVDRMLAVATVAAARNVRSTSYDTGLKEAAFEVEKTAQAQAAASVTSEPLLEEDLVRVAQQTATPPSIFSIRSPSGRSVRTGSSPSGSDETSPRRPSTETDHPTAPRSPESGTPSLVDYLQTQVKARRTAHLPALLNEVFADFEGSEVSQLAATTLAAVFDTSGELDPSVEDVAPLVRLAALGEPAIPLEPRLHIHDRLLQLALNRGRTSTDAAIMARTLSKRVEQLLDETMNERSATEASDRTKNAEERIRAALLPASKPGPPPTPVDGVAPSDHALIELGISTAIPLSPDMLVSQLRLDADTHATGEKSQVMRSADAWTLAAAAALSAESEPDKAAVWFLRAARTVATGTDDRSGQGTGQQTEAPDVQSSTRADPADVLAALGLLFSDAMQATGPIAWDTVSLECATWLVSSSADGHGGPIRNPAARVSSLLAGAAPGYRNRGDSAAEVLAASRLRAAVGQTSKLTGASAAEIRQALVDYIEWALTGVSGNSGDQPILTLFPIEPIGRVGFYVTELFSTTDALHAGRRHAIDRLRQLPISPQPTELIEDSVRDSYEQALSGASALRALELIGLAKQAEQWLGGQTWQSVIELIRRLGIAGDPLD